MHDDRRRSAATDGSTSDPARARARHADDVPGRERSTAVVVVLAILGGAFVWLRQSSLVAVQTVTITGVAGPDAAQIRETLRASAERMTTLAVSEKTLKQSVASYPVVRGLTVSTDFPHGHDDRRLRAGAGRGHLSRWGPNRGVGQRHAAAETNPTGALPTITSRSRRPAARRLVPAAAQVALLADAPYALLAQESPPPV